MRVILTTGEQRVSLTPEHAWDGGPVDVGVAYSPSCEEAPAGSHDAVSRIRAFLDEHKPPTPCLVIDLETVRERYRQLVSALPLATAYYAVKANPMPDVVRELIAQGSSFDVASIPEIELCLREGASPADLSYGNTIKKPADIATAYALGVRLYTSDSASDIEALAAHAPGSSVFCRIMLADTGSLTPFGRKFGCAPAMAADLLIRAAELGLTPAGVSFHVGSQQLNPQAWDRAVAEAAGVAASLVTVGIALPLLNIGGGFPGRYADLTPPLTDYARVIDDSVHAHFGSAGLPVPRLILEPGRFLVAEAGLLRSEVVLVSRKSHEETTRWVYLDVGRYTGMAETENEYITYQIATPGRGGVTGPVIVAGPTCDGDDVLYQRNIYPLPLSLQAGDYVDFLSTGAYTSSYSSIAFNGFEPLYTHTR